MRDSELAVTWTGAVDQKTVWRNPQFRRYFPA